MLQFIAIHRLPFVVILALLLGAIFWRGGWRSSLMGTAAGVAIGSFAVMVAIVFNVTELWWLPPDQQTPLNFDVPSLLDPVVAPVEAIAAGQLHIQAAVIAMKFFAYYTIAEFAATIVIIALMIWERFTFRRDVRFLRQMFKDNPQLLDK